MLVVSLADFANGAFNREEPCRIEENGVTIGKFTPKGSKRLWTL